MELACAEMRKSKSEHAHKYDPLVGAVLVGRDGRVIGEAHRGNLRVGDHAEYTLIERLHGNKDLQGTTLFVTLEPCTLRDAPKVPCAKRILSARIARVVIGMVDPNPDIEGHGVALLLQNKVEVDFFDSDLCEQIRTENKAFIEQYSRAEEPLPEEEEYPGPSDKEKEPVAFTSVDDFSYQAIKEYLAARKKPLRVPSRELWKLFQSHGFVTQNEKSGSFTPTVAGLLLFGKNPEDSLVQSKVKAEAHKGTRIKAVDIGGPLLSMPDRIKAFLEEYGPTYTIIKDFKRVEEPEYPWDAVREALINAIVHRDYREGARVFVQLLGDRLVIKSPGLPLSPLSLAKIRAYNAPPFSRNPRVADTFCQMKLMEERGWGFKRMRDLLVSHGLPPPQFNIDNGYFVITFLGQKRGSGTARIAPELLETLDARKKKILDLVRKRGRISRNECMAALKISMNIAKRDLKALVEAGLLEARGKGPAAYYVLIGS